MSQPKITTFANELLDKIFAYLVDKDDWRALCTTHRSFTASGQRFIFGDIEIPAQHRSSSTARCSLLLRALTDSPHLVELVQTLQIDCCLEDNLVLEQDAIRAILAKIQSLQRLNVFIVEQPELHLTTAFTSYDIAYMLRNQPTIKEIVINCPERRLYNARALFTLASATTLYVRHNTSQRICLMWSSEAAKKIWHVSFENLKSIDYAPIIAPIAAAKFGGTPKPEKLRFTWSTRDSFIPFDACIQGLVQTQHTLRELTILPDTIYAGTLRSWKSADFSTFTALEILRVPALALFEPVSCSSLATDDERTVWEDRDDITHLLPPNLRELELWFKHPAGIFATGWKYLSKFQELPEDERMLSFGWILALLQMRSLWKVRLSEVLCNHVATDVERTGSCPTHRHTLPDAVGRAFREAETELEIEVLETEGRKLRCGCEGH
ncbi:hypothetical protein ACET3X_007143 [Alternaria dauci]|uniref:F-box domain-containing protein n=1 Tax=Alternaria dauci TaxID=48095 RepID=A0ABR3UGK0_9PLEO